MKGLAVLLAVIFMVFNVAHAIIMKMYDDKFIDYMFKVHMITNPGIKYTGFDMKVFIEGTLVHGLFGFIIGYIIEIMT